MSNQGPDAMCRYNSVTGSVDLPDQSLHDNNSTSQNGTQTTAFIISKKKLKGMSKMLQDIVYCIELQKFVCMFVLC